MIVRTIHVYVAKDSVEAFREATIRNHEASIREAGVLRFDVLQDSEDDTHFLLYEVYRSEAAADSHKATPHYAEWKTAVEPMMSRDRERSAFDVVAPRDPAAWKG